MLTAMGKIKQRVFLQPTHPIWETLEVLEWIRSLVQIFMLASGNNNFMRNSETSKKSYTDLFTGFKQKNSVQGTHLSSSKHSGQNQMVSKINNASGLPLKQEKEGQPSASITSIKIQKPPSESSNTAQSSGNRGKKKIKTTTTNTYQQVDAIGKVDTKVKTHFVETTTKGKGQNIYEKNIQYRQIQEAGETIYFIEDCLEKKTLVRMGVNDEPYTRIISHQSQREESYEDDDSVLDSKLSLPSEKEVASLCKIEQNSKENAGDLTIGKKIAEDYFNGQKAFEDQAVLEEVQARLKVLKNRMETKTKSEVEERKMQKLHKAVDELQYLISKKSQQALTFKKIKSQNLGGFPYSTGILDQRSSSRPPGDSDKEKRVRGSCERPPQPGEKDEERQKLEMRVSSSMGSLPESDDEELDKLIDSLGTLNQKRSKSKEASIFLNSGTTHDLSHDEQLVIEIAKSLLKRFG